MTDDKSNADVMTRARANMVIGLTFAFFMGFHILYPILPLFIVDIGASKFELGIIMSILRGIVILTILPFGIVASRIGKWPTLLMSICMQLITFLFYAIAPSPIFLYPITALYALSLASFGPISTTMALESVPMSKHGSIMGRYFGSIGGAMILGPTLAGILALQFNYRQIFLVTSLFPLFCVIPFISVRGIMDFSKKEIRVAKEKIMPFKSIFKVLSQRNIFVICFGQLTFYIATGIFDTLFPIYAKESLWLATSAISILFAVRGLPNALIRFPIGSLSDKIGRLKPIIFSHLLAFLVLYLIPDMRNIFALALLIGIYGAAWGARIPLVAVFLAGKVKSGDINIASSLLWLTSFFGMALGSLVAGSTTLILQMPIIFKVSSISILPGILALLLVKDNIRKN